MKTEHLLADIGYTVVTEPHENGLSISWWVHENDEGDPDDFKAEVFAEGFTKWDGCSNFVFPESGCMIHTCERENMVNIGLMLARVHDLCGSLMPRAIFTPEVKT